MKRRQEGYVDGLRREGTLPVCRAPNDLRQGGGCNGTEI
jgi:hypothetical protein